MPQALSEIQVEAGLRFHCSYTSTPLEQLLGRRDVLALIHFNGNSAPHSDRRVINTGSATLANSAPTEIWSTNLPVEVGGELPLTWTKTAEFIVLCYRWRDGGDKTLETATFDAYTTLLQNLQAQGFPHIQRAWNYIADINQGSGDDERYKRFCSGRHRAFAASDLAPDHFPAACAIGHHAEFNVIYLLGSKNAGRHFENPRQISAYNYPRQYGKDSPSFARATICGIDRQRLYLSGTASVLGHETRCRDDALGQLRETLLNIEALVEHVNAGLEQQRPVSSGSPEVELLKVYIRDANLSEPIKFELARHFPDAPITYLLGDICRTDLLLEIDGQFIFPTPRQSSQQSPQKGSCAVPKI